MAHWGGWEEGESGEWGILICYISHKGNETLDWRKCEERACLGLFLSICWWRSSHHSALPSFGAGVVLSFFPLPWDPALNVFSGADFVGSPSSGSKFCIFLNCRWFFKVSHCDMLIVGSTSRRGSKRWLWSHVSDNCSLLGHTFAESHGYPCCRHTSAIPQTAHGQEFCHTNFHQELWQGGVVQLPSKAFLTTSQWCRRSWGLWLLLFSAVGIV